ncbi:hypothetical protein [Mucilaginibacter sp.]|uniref:hypothetical protein n=1 Tax=Mucilaginibacter sp. TaxID=1882438 RepID=UPI0035BC6647
MPNYHQTITRIILLFVAILATALGILVFINPAALFPDPSWGFQVMRSMEMGSGFNLLTRPEHENLAKNTSEFLTWWSPGQYLIPYFFKFTLHLNTGQAAAVTTALCQLSGLAGLYMFFRKAGFSALISALSLLFIICQQAFYNPYIFYNGGEVLLFAFFGWYLYGCFVINKPGVSLVLFVVFAGWIGFICKSSFMWMYAAGLMFIWVRMASGETKFIQWIKKGLWPGIPAVIAVTAIYFFYLSKGANPSSEAGNLNFSSETFTFPLASPILSGFSADDLAGGLIYHNDVPVFSHSAAIMVLTILAIVSVLLIRAILIYVPKKDYIMMLIIFYAISVLFFTYTYLRGMAISLEARHFRLIGLLVVPGMIYVIGRLKRPYHVVLMLASLIILSFSLVFYNNSYIQLKTEDPHGKSGIAQQFIDREAMDYLARLDDTNRNALFVFTSPDLGLDIKHNRIITLQPLNDDIRINFDQYVHKGHAGPLFILLPSRYIGVRASIFIKCFPGYKAFSLKEISEDYVLYYSNTYR